MMEWNDYPKTMLKAKLTAVRNVIDVFLNKLDCADYEEQDFLDFLDLCKLNGLNLFDRSMDGE